MGLLITNKEFKKIKQIQIINLITMTKLNDKIIMLGNENWIIELLRTDTFDIIFSNQLDQPIEIRNFSDYSIR